MDHDSIWRDFRDKLQSGALTDEDCARPELASFLNANQGMKDFIARCEEPMCESGEQKLIFRLKSGATHEIRLDFATDEGEWRLCTLDGLTLPVGDIAELPFADFAPYPDHVDWIRLELAVTEQVFLYLRLKEEKGKEEALSWFRDGEGYVRGVEAWVPYFTLRRSFVAYAGWIERRCWGHRIVIEEFSDERSTLLFEDYDLLRLYDVAGHLQPKLAREEFVELFEDRWRDRAWYAGWLARFTYDGYDTRMILSARVAQ